MPGLSAARVATATARKNTNLAITILEALKRIARLLTTLVRSSAFMRSSAPFKPDPPEGGTLNKIAYSVGIPSASSARGRFLPRAVLFFPIVQWFAVDLVNGRLGDFHFARLAGQKEIDVVSLSVRGLHIHAGEVFAATEIGQTVVMHFNQVESKILTLVFDMKFAVAALFGFGFDVLFYTGGNIGGANLFRLRALFRVLRGFLWMLRMLLGIECHCRGEEERDCCCQDKS